MKTVALALLFISIQLACTTNVVHAVTPSQQAALNIWLQQQKNINPRPLDIISNLENIAKKFKIRIYRYNINSSKITIKATSKIKSNILKYKRILDTTFMFDEILIRNIKYKNKRYYFQMKLDKANIEKRGIYQKSKHIIFKSQTQVKYSVNKIIAKIKPIGKLMQFCPSTPLKVKPIYPGARIKLIIFSYHLNFTSSLSEVKKTLAILSNARNYISLHNLKMVSKKGLYELDLDLRFYHLSSRRNNSDKPFVYQKVKADKICEL